MTGNYLDGLITEPDQVAEVLEIVSRSEKVAIDCETTGLDFNYAELFGVVLTVPDHDWFLIGNAMQAALPHLAELSKSNIQWLLWNAPFDFHFLKPHGFWPVNFVDAEIAAYLIDENQSMELKEQARLRLGITEDLPSFKDLQMRYKGQLGYKRRDQVKIHEIPLEVLNPYACRDGRLTYDIWLVLEPLLKEEGLYTYFFETEMPLIRVLQEMEATGVYMDKNRLGQLNDEYIIKLSELNESWEEITNGVNPNSPQQIAKYFYETLGYKATRFTDGGQGSTDKLTLQRLKDKDKTGSAKLLLEIRKLSKLITTYLVNIHKHIFNGRLFGRYRRAGAVTGRLSSSDPNLQNIPVRTELGRAIRSAFIATPGYDLIVSDYSQLELRIAAHYSRDKLLTEIFLTGGDPHNLTSELTKAPRYESKTLNYMKFYGASLGGIADMIEEETGLRPKISQVRMWLNAWDDGYAGVTKWSNNVLDYARKLGYIQTITRRKRRLPEINSPVPGFRARAERQAVNAVIQGTASDVINYAMITLPPVLNWFGARMLLQIHDELVVEAPQDVSQEVAQCVKYHMEQAGSYFGLRIPLVAEPGIGPNWADAKK